jgi:membrane protease subunit (stomatin/prohibitin family)
VLLTLTALSTFENRIGESNPLQYQIGFNKDEYSIEQIEHQFAELELEFTRTSLSKRGADIRVTFILDVPGNKVEKLNTLLVNNPNIKTFDT